MTHCKLIYNPYKAMTKLYFKDKEVWEEIDDTSIFINIFHEPISKWLYPTIDTPGFFAQLHHCGDTKYEISFYGLKSNVNNLI